MRWLFSLLLFAFLGAVSALSASGTRVLVVLEEEAEKNKYTQLFGDLDSRGFQLTYTTPKTTSLSLFTHDERAYDHLLLLPGKTKGLGPSLTAHKILEFSQKEGNVLLALSGNTPVASSITALLLELDIHLPADRNALVVDHFNFDAASAAEKHDVLLVKPPVALKQGVKNYFAGEGVIAVPRAVGHTLGNSSPLLVPILRASKSAYSYNPKDEADAVEDPFATGEQLALISAMQARNSARFTVLGSTEMLENTWFDAKVKRNGHTVKTINREFVKKVTSWAFKEIGVLKVGRFQHYLDEGKKPNWNISAVGIPAHNPTIYRIKNEVTVLIELSEWTTNGYTPFLPPSFDNLQLEFSMLSPFHRIPMYPVDSTPTSMIFGAHFTTPDQHGIFNFRVNYKRPFLTNVDVKEQVTVRHFAHDEWPRSYVISGAWTWVAGIWVTIVGWIAFVAVWLYSAPTKTGGVKKTQ